MIERQQKMKLKTLKRKNKYFYMGVICGVMLLTLLIFNTSRAKYRTTQSIELARGTINYTVPDLNLVSMYIEDNGTYKGTDTVPQSGYKVNSDKSYCAVNGNKDTSITFDYSNGKINVNNLTKKGTKCYLYFDVKKLTVQDIIASKTISTRTDFSTILSTDTTGTIYTAADDYGTSYYYAGAPTDNWVKFGGFYWRIIRINGDGTIRMIYNGPTTDQIEYTTQIGQKAFNLNEGDNMYVGYQYTSGEVHGRGTDSTIKEILDNWYNNSLKDYSNYIATGNGANFCNDRTPYSGTGTGDSDTVYAAQNRLITNKTPTFKCTDAGDRFATPIGLITADEVAYAGGVDETQNSGYYLFTGLYYWTMSPSGPGEVFTVAGDYFFYGHGTPEQNGYLRPFPFVCNFFVRPVINLKADTQFTSGNGTSSNPYTV